LAALATPEQRRACTPDVYRLCRGEIPNVRAFTACAAAKGQPQRGLRGGVRAVRDDRGVAAVTTAQMASPAIRRPRPARLLHVTIDASNQIGVAQMTAQIPVVMQSTGRNWVNVANLARHPGWAPENDTALKVE
jgi:hypothetical protein